MILIYLVASFLIATIWFNSSELLIYTDTHFPFMNIEKYLERVFTIPDTGYFPSFYDIRHILLYTYPFPFIPFACLWNLQIASLMQRIMLFLVLFFSLGSISYFLFCVSSITGQRLSRIAVLLSALLYCFNIYAAIIIWRPLMPYIFHYALFPLFVAFSLRYFSTDHNKYLLALMILSLLIFPSYTILPSLAFDFIVIIILLLSVRSKFQKSLLETIVTSLKIFSGILILMIPLGLLVLSEPTLILAQYSRIVSSQELIALLNFNSPMLIRALFYSGYPPLYTSHFAWYANYTARFEPLLLVSIGILLTVGIISWAKSRNTDYLCFSFLFLWLLFLSIITGSNEPFPQFKILIFQTKFLDVLRSTYARFGEYVILSSLPFLSIGMSKIILILKSQIYKLYVGAILALVLMGPMLPILTGDFLKMQSSEVPSTRVSFPDSYIKLGQLDEKGRGGNYLYLTLPSSNEVRKRFWENGTRGYIGPDIFPFILNGRSIVDEKIRRNILYFIINDKFEELQNLLPLRYVILTFDQKISDVERQSLYNYFEVFRKKLNTIFVDDNIAIFKLSANTKGALGDWRVRILTQNESSILADIFSNSYYTLIYDDLPLEVSYIKQNYIGKALDFSKLRRMEIISAVNLKKTTEKYYVYPIFLVLPQVTEILYVAAEYKPDEKSWNVYWGVWSNERLKWNYTLLTTLSSSDVIFSVNFTRNRLMIESYNDRQEYQIPEEWRKILDSRLKLSNNSAIFQGEIRIFATEKLTEVVAIDEFLVKIYGEDSVETIPYTASYEMRTTMISPSLSKVSVTSKEPFIIAFVEAYNPSWVCYVNGEKVQNIRLYGMINGFWINQTGFLEITIEYEPQKWFYYGSAVSLLTLAGRIIYLAKEPTHKFITKLHKQKEATHKEKKIK